jgi:PPOX class probable F420-dependent enzyme
MPYHAITPDEVHSLLNSDPPHTGKLATVRPDGRPHVAPVWFVVDPDGSVLITTMKDSVKGRNLRHAGRAALCVDVETPPYAFVLIEGSVEWTDDLDQLRTATGRVGARYMGPDRAEEFAARNGVPGGLVVRLRPDKVTGAVDLSDSK